MKTEELKKQNSINLEPYYQAMEEDTKLLEEAFETVLEMVSTDSKTAKKIAHLIKEDFHGLFKEVVALSTPEKNQDNTPSCCGGH
tara:strand:+ start:290 stop:544 length:255 start_codon:yes stop_codon:yes gene_type:complete